MMGCDHTCVRVCAVCVCVCECGCAVCVGMCECVSVCVHVSVCVLYACAYVSASLWCYQISTTTKNAQF